MAVKLNTDVTESFLASLEQPFGTWGWDVIEMLLWADWGWDVIEMILWASWGWDVIKMILWASWG